MSSANFFTQLPVLVPVFNVEYVCEDVPEVGSPRNPRDISGLQEDVGGVLGRRIVLRNTHMSYTPSTPLIITVVLHYIIPYTTLYKTP